MTPKRRTYGKDANGAWVVVTTDEKGFDDQVWLTTLCQVLLLNLQEDPRFGNYGIPSLSSVQTGVPPDTFVAIVQQQFSQYFASLQISRVVGANVPTYNINVLCNNGAAKFIMVAT